MNFEKYYLKLPDFIKYNSKIYNVSMKISKYFNKTNNSDELNSCNELFNLLFTGYDIKIKGPRRDIQLLFIELLRFVDNVCNKYDIDYWLGFGTLLGAVRHEGFIPWDDDIDLAMLREDYNKLIEVLPKEIEKLDYLKENCGLSLMLENNQNYFNDFRSVYEFADNHAIEQYRLSFLQFAWMKPYVKIDFFPMDFIKDGKVDDVYKNLPSMKYKFYYDLIQNKINFFDELKKKRKEVGFIDSKSEYFSDTFESVYFWRVRAFKYDETFPLKTIKFEGYDFKCPKNPDHHLKETFNEEYMKIPKVIESHEYLSFIQSQFNSTDEMNQSFKKAINYLKEINDNFE